VVEIDERNDYQRCDEKVHDQGFRCEAEFEVDAYGKQTGHQFNHGVTHGNNGLTTAALSPEQKKTEDGDVVIKPDGRLAPWAGRRWVYNRFGIGESVDAYI
jgi:hypothetical protein